MYLLLQKKLFLAASTELYSLPKSYPTSSSVYMKCCFLISSSEEIFWVFASRCFTAANRITRETRPGQETSSSDLVHTSKLWNANKPQMKTHKVCPRLERKEKLECFLFWPQLTCFCISGDEKAKSSIAGFWLQTRTSETLGCRDIYSWKSPH